MRMNICPVCNNVYDVPLVTHIRNEHNLLLDAYAPSNRYKSFRARNRLPHNLDEEILGWEPYNNVDAFLNGDNSKMLYWNMTGK